MLPKSVYNKQLQRFKFWYEQTLQDGMRYQHQFFRCLQVVDYRQRSSLYRIGYRLAQQGADILITCDTDRSQATCSLWVNLRPRHSSSLSVRPELAHKPRQSSKGSLAS